MRKSNSALKRRKFIRKFTISFLLIQITIATLAGSLLYESSPINMDDCASQKIIVQAREYKRVYGEHVCQISSNGAIYWFPNLGMFEKYSSRELYEEMEPGKSLDITYTEGRNFFAKHNLIVDARSESTIYLDFGTYNNEKGKLVVAVIIMFSVIELVFLAIFICIFLFNSKELKLLPNEKKEKTSKTINN